MWSRGDAFITPSSGPIYPCTRKYTGGSPNPSPENLTETLLMMWGCIT